MEVRAHARCKPCHTSDLSSFLSCWTMPGLHRKARESGGQGSEEERRGQQDTHGGGRYCKLLVSPWGCARGSSSVPTLRWGWWHCPIPRAEGVAGLRLSSAEAFAALSAQVSPPPAPLPALPDCHSLQSCPSRGWSCHPRPVPAPVTTLGHSSQPVPGHAWRLFLSLAGGTAAVASFCPGSGFVGEVC